ncbi:MAG: B12-binding domain-containing radical SAM protein [Firmicutes bacterium]|nr:B12-binding domain-containing radical SAM protein [Bacillota bacterium]
MKILFVSIDSKYIHTNLAVRYLKANCSSYSTIIEFTIKDSLEVMYQKILNETFDVIAFSAYIWNIEIIQTLTQKLKQNSDCIILWGGPEVSYDPDYFLEHFLVDAIISQEGEIAFNEYVLALENHLPLRDVPNLVYKESGKIIHNRQELIKDLNSLKTPYYFEEDVSSIPNKIQYIETSRGCPFHCSYCLASLDNKVRFFNIERVKNDIEYLIEKGAKTFKFLDRTFNTNPIYAKEIFDFIIKHSLPNTSFQFEITGDILPKELIEYINSNAPKNLIRFEIGIQSTNLLSNLAVDRHQDTLKLFDTISLIQKGAIIDLHLDLIAGLPYENLVCFEKTFNEVFSLYAKELQLGFLKMLRGTKIRKEALQYGYEFDFFAPYEITKTHELTKEDLNKIHIVESMLELYWNKGFMNHTIKSLTNCLPSSFAFFLQLGTYYKQNNYNLHRYQLSDLFKWFYLFILKFYLEESETVLANLKFDYLNHFRIKPQIWWNQSKINKNQLIRDFFSKNQTIKIDDLYKYGIVTTFLNQYLLFVYFPNQTLHFMF